MASSSSQNASSSGIGFGGLLFIVLLVLKLTHVIDWSWWWVTAPLWGPFAVALAGAAVFFLFQLAAALPGEFRRVRATRRRRKEMGRG